MLSKNIIDINDHRYISSVDQGTELKVTNSYLLLRVESGYYYFSFSTDCEARIDENTNHVRAIQEHHL